MQADRQESRLEKKGDGLGTAEREELARLRRENKQLRVERDILSRSAAWFARRTLPRRKGRRSRSRRRAVRVFGFVSANQAIFPTAAMARVLGVSEAVYLDFAQLTRPRGQARIQNAGSAAMNASASSSDRTAPNGPAGPQASRRHHNTSRQSPDGSGLRRATGAPVRAEIKV